MDIFTEPLKSLNEYSFALKSIQSGENPVSISGLADSQKAHIAFCLYHHLGKKGVIVANSDFEARKMAQDISLFIGKGVFVFPSRELVLFSAEAQNKDYIYERLDVLKKIVDGDYSIIVTSIDALMNKISSASDFIEGILKLEFGANVHMEHLIKKLIEIGYESTDIVEGRGQVAKRGGIVDIFPVNSQFPVRIEFFDDVIDSLRFFDVDTQRSIENIQSVEIIPATEYVIDPDRARKAGDAIERELNKAIKVFEKSQSRTCIENLKANIGLDIEKLRNGRHFTGMDRYIAALLDSPSTLFEYLGHDALVFIDEPDRCRQRADDVLSQAYEIIKDLIKKGSFIPEYSDVLWDYDVIVSKIQKNTTVLLDTLMRVNTKPRPAQAYNIISRTVNSYRGRLDMAIEQVKQWKNDGYKVIVLTATELKGRKLSDLFISEGIENTFMHTVPTVVQNGQIVIVQGNINNGFEYPSIKFALISDKEIFGYERKNARTHRRGQRRKIQAFTDLNVGDFVVHYAHGVGQYVGIEKLVVERITKDYLKIKYLNDDFLYIPTMNMDLLQKYIGSGGKNPRLNKLGGADWSKTKSRVKQSLREFAGELVKLYAERETAEGFKFSPDTVWQGQFESTFPYEETPDQLKCISDVKKDMETDKSMDRLLCGDVGYGKTEVAIRAAFKAVMDGKQVAYLVPTTILAQQQYINFMQRMQGFPVNVEMLSRFRSRTEQKHIISQLKRGIVDIIIGTHRIIQEDVEFKDLGLIIIDEEHRFGVAHKEKLKIIKKNVDVLTLTATPIPRTLHMALTGIRDISTIEDPPAERYPVQTYVMEYDVDTIRDAIAKELARGGQVFYLYNRVKSIYRRAREIQRMIPEARIAVGHGQMDESMLEDLMSDFITGEYDILVCTTIIESGLDISNANTIIIEDADRMGLAQLYQLRGRVGRGNRIAYAYVTYVKDKVLTEQASRKLQTIREFTEFGSGFKIAMRDLEIRGAGNLLGAEQHGYMEAVGYEMYCKLLEEAIGELTGKATGEPVNEITIDLRVNAHIDDDYIEDELQRIEAYKKIASIREEQDAIDVGYELIDRYGDMPEATENLIKIAEIKALAMHTGISSIAEKAGNIIFYLNNSKGVNVDAISRLTQKYSKHIAFVASDEPYLSYRMSGQRVEVFFSNIKFILQDLKSFAELTNINYN